MARWSPYALPPLGLIFLVVMAAGFTGTFAYIACALVLTGAVVAAIHHAEVIAHRVGEPFGTLVLAIAITIIEAAMILSVMLVPGKESAALPRDAIFAALMLICSGVLGICLFLGGLRHVEQRFRVEGATSALAAMVTLAVLTLILPKYTTTTPDATFSSVQLGVVAALSLILWIAFVRIQVGRHREYFLPEHEPFHDAHDSSTSRRRAWSSAGMLLVALVAVVGLAKQLASPLESWIAEQGLPRAVIGVAIATLVLLPESGAAVRAARANRFQTSINLALGSALASIGLTIPVVAVASIMLGLPLQLGLDPKHSILLALTFAVNGLTLGLGRSNILLGVVHLVLFTVFLLITFVP